MSSIALAGRVSSGSTRRWHGRTLADTRRPVATAWQPPTAGARRQPTPPPIARVVIARPLSTGPIAAPHAHGAAGQVSLTDRGLAVLVIGFLLALVLGAAIVVGQFISIPADPIASNSGTAVAGAAAGELVQA